MQLNKIRNDLKAIRYYFSRKDFFDKFSALVMSDVISTVKVYNEIIKSAHPRLYDVYINLYIENLTQESLADVLGYTPEYIQMLHKKLLLFFQSKLYGQGGCYGYGYG